MGYGFDTIYIELTNRCNLRCKMCFRHEMVRREQDMDFALYQKVLTMAKEIGVSHVRLIMYGEPLLYPYLSQAITAATGEFRQVDFDSNALVLSEGMAQELLHTPVSRLYFSHTGFTDAIYSQFQGYQRNVSVVDARNNILEFLKLRNEKGVNIPVVMLYILTPESEREAETYCEFWQDKVDAIYFSKLDSIFGRIEAVRVRERISRPCPLLGRQLAVYANGDVTICCADHRGDNIIGNVETNTLKELVDSSLYQAILEANARNLSMLPPLCQTCDISHADYFQAVDYRKVKQYRKRVAEMSPGRYVLSGLKDELNTFYAAMRIFGQGKFEQVIVTDPAIEGYFDGKPVLTPDKVHGDMQLICF